MNEALAPPVGEVLTAETVKLLVKGDLLRHTASATDVEFLNVCGRTLSAMVLRKGRPYEAMFCNLTFLSRPSLAAPTVQEGEDLGLLRPEAAFVPDMNKSGDGDLYARAVILATRDKPSTSYLQRRLQIGFNYAAALIERMVDEGLISTPNSAGKRTILKPYIAPDGPEVGADAVGLILSKYLDLINQTPALLSLLYDADLMPEQTVTVRGAILVGAVCEAFKMGMAEAASTCGIAPSGDEPNPNPHEAERRIALEAGDIDDIDILVGLYATKSEHAVWSRMRALLTTKTGE